MKTVCTIIIVAALALILSTPTLATDPVGTAFTYQGRLMHNGDPVADPVNLVFRMYASAVGGAPLGTLNAPGVVLGDDGHFTIDLDFGFAFTGAARWLEIVVNGTTLSPRQPIMPAPHAMFATTTASVPPKAMAGVYTGITGVGTLGSLNVSGDAFINGKLGIGTAAPISALDIFRTTNDADGIWMRTSGPASTSFYGYQAGNTQAQHLLDAQQNNWRLRLGTTGGAVTDRMVVDIATGNVGIGTSTPAQRLHVVGRLLVESSAFPIQAVKDGGGTFPAVHGESNSTAGTASGVRGFITSEMPGSSSAGVWGNNAATTSAGYGVRGNHEGGGYGVFGQSATGRGVSGIVSAASGTTYGVHGQSSSTTGRGVFGTATATTGAAFGVFGQSASSAGRGVFGNATSATGSAAGVYGSAGSSTGRGVWGLASHTTGTNYGVLGSTLSANGFGVYGSNIAANGVGVYGTSSGAAGIGVRGVSQWGVHGLSNEGGFDSAGLRGHSSESKGVGVHATVAGTGAQSAAVWGVVSGNAWAGFFEGNVRVAGTLLGDTKNFLIDNPANPDNEYLVHSCIESDEMKNLYDGVVMLDALGEAVVTLPNWFEHLNADFRYQLTCVGGYAPVYIAQELANGRFTIAGKGPDAIGLKVSWQITGNRIDPAARDSGFRTVIPKPDGERGKLLYPEGYGRPASDRIERMANPMPRRQPSNGIAPLAEATISAPQDEQRTSTEAADL